MKKNIFIIFIFLACLLTSCSAPQVSETDEEGTQSSSSGTKVKIYFTKSTKSKGVALVPIVRNVPVDKNEIDSALRELFLGPTKSEIKQGIMTEIPVGTRLIKVEESDDEILIDVSSQYLIGGGSASVQLRYLQLYNTLQRIARDKKFYLHVDGKTLTTLASEGLEVTQPLSRIEDYTKKYEEAKDVQP